MELMAVQMVETFESRIAARYTTVIFGASAVAANMLVFKLLQYHI